MVTKEKPELRAPGPGKPGPAQHNGGHGGDGTRLPFLEVTAGLEEECSGGRRRWDQQGLWESRCVESADLGENFVFSGSRSLTPCAPRWAVGTTDFDLFYDLARLPLLV